LLSLIKILDALFRRIWIKFWLTRFCTIEKVVYSFLSSLQNYSCNIHICHDVISIIIEHDTQPWIIFISWKKSSYFSSTHFGNLLMQSCSRPRAISREVNNWREALNILFFAFYQEKHTVLELCSDHHSSHLHYWLTYLVTHKRNKLGKVAHIINQTFFPWYTYLSPKVSRVGHKICPL